MALIMNIAGTEPKAEAKVAVETPTPTDLTVAKTIMEQLGGRKFTVMTGAKNYVGSNNSLSFRLPGAGGFCKHGINAVHIELTPDDTYTLTFNRIRAHKITEVKRFVGIYFDQLQGLFTEVTGLQTSLGTMGGNLKTMAVKRVVKPLKLEGPWRGFANRHED